MRRFPKNLPFPAIFSRYSARQGHKECDIMKVAAATKQIGKKGVQKAARYYFSQTASLFYKPLLKDTSKSVMLSIMLMRSQRPYGTDRLYKIKEAAKYLC